MGNVAVESVAGVRGPATRILLFVVVFAAGFTITGIEIALGRLLAPHFGASLTVWAAIIASVIGALSFGYPLGGVLADRHPGPDLPLLGTLAGGLIGAGLGIGVPLWLGGAMAGVGLNGPAFWGRLCGVLALFALPCVFLATVPPAILRVTLRQRETAGRDAGWVYALGSLGSVLGILLPALWWIPLLGLRATFLLLGLVSALPAALGLASGLAGTRLRPLSCLLLLLPGSFTIPEGDRAPADPGVQVLYDRESGLQRIRVLSHDRGDHRVRSLQLNEGWSVHSKLVERSYATGDVWDWMALGALLARPRDGRTDVLILGLAGGTVSTMITRLLGPLLPDLSITGVEIDPEVIVVADRYFEMDRSRLEAVVADARIWLRGQDRRFDLIILDAYRQPSIPAHLATVEFFAEVERRLTDTGLAVLNVFAPAGRSRILDGISRTWSHVFPRSQIFSGPEFSGFASRLLFGGPAVPVDFGAFRPEQLPPQLREAWRLLAAETHPLHADRRGVAWTDDRAPVELLTDRAFRSLRPPNPIAGIP